MRCNAPPVGRLLFLFTLNLANMIETETIYIDLY